MMDRSRHSDAGFTLVEVLMAMIVLGIGVSALLTAFATEAKTSLSNRNQSAAESLLTAAAEYVKALPYTSCSAISGTITTAQVPFDNTEFTVTYGPGTAVSGVSMCAIQAVPVKVDGISNGYHLNVTVVKRPSVEPSS